MHWSVTYGQNPSRPGRREASDGRWRLVDGREGGHQAGREAGRETGREACRIHGEGERGE